MEEFQRNFVWHKNKKSLLIEPLMLSIPSPAFYFYGDESGRRTAIDGMQRLNDLSLFKGVKLQGLQNLKEWLH